VPFEAGFRYATPVTVCTGREQCESLNPPMELGRIYEMEAEVSYTGFAPSDAPGRLWEVVKGVRKKYPGVGINYVWISDDGTRVIIQVFDPGARPLGWQLIAVLVLILAILIAGAVILNMVLRATEEHLPPMPPSAKKAFWYVVLAAAAALSAGYLIRSVRG